MEALVLAIFSGFSGLAGGLIALRSRSLIGGALGFTAGALVGVVAFGILPEVFELAGSTGLDVVWPMAALVAGFLAFHILEKSILLHHSHEHEYPAHNHPYVGIVSAAAIAGHSFLDGLAIGLAFQISSSVGLAVALAVIGHRFADGFNIINLLQASRNSRRLSLYFLMAGSLAPIAGVLIAFVISLPDTALAIFLGFFGGFLLYIGASDILPQAHRRGPSYKTILATVVGALFMFAISLLA